MANLKVQSLIDPGKTAIIEEVLEPVRTETFELLDYANGLVIHTGFWSRTTYTVKKLVCPHCKQEHTDLKFTEYFDSWYWNSIVCSCRSRLVLSFHTYELTCAVKKLIVPSGYTLVESD